MLKVWSFLMEKPERAMNIADIISHTSTGRTSAFKALYDLQRTGIVEIAENGNQKEVRVAPSLQSFSIKLLDDSIKFKSLDGNAKLAISVFLGSLHTPEARAVFVFGSVLSGKAYNDIDIAVVYKEKIDQSRVIWARAAAEIVCDKPVNVHFNNSELNNQLDGICVRGFEYYVSLFEKRHALLNQYNEALKWLDSASNNLTDKGLFSDCLGNALLNLAFSYCILNNMQFATKNNVLEIFRKKHGNLFKAKGAEKMQLLRKAAVEIGKGIYK